MILMHFVFILCLALGGQELAPSGNYNLIICYLFI